MAGYSTGATTAYGYTTLKGHEDDYTIRRARKESPCNHGAAGLPTPCSHPVIAPGEVYVSVRQSWLDRSVLSAPCALAYGIIAPAQEG